MTKNIIKLIREGFSSLFNNLIVLLPFLFQSVLVVLIISFGLFLFLKMFNVTFLDLVLGKISQEQLQELFVSALPSSAMSFKIFFIFLVTFLASLLVSSYFVPGAIGMMYSFFKSNKKPTLKDMHNYGKKFFWRYFFLVLIIDIFFFIVAFLAFLPVLFSSSSPWSLILFMIIFIILVIFYLFFILAPFILIVKDCFVFQAIKKSFSLTKSNFWVFLGLAALYILLSGLIQTIPYAGSILSAFVINPAINFSFVLFSVERSG